MRSSSVGLPLSSHHSEEQLKPEPGPGQGGGRHTFGSGLPVMVLTSSWRCGQLPWEYQPGLSSDGSPSLSSTSFTAGREERESDTTVGPNRPQLRDRRHQKPSTAEHRRTHQQAHTETE
ncbi:hypothetical protein EYF80_004392 [Liparis tanakae]|uniref:Uncharacterized protein n=1 Tax=Liparis tanakae TaxID=230148 RepID=A0A4Z2J5C0_9TELE|nr:hypothetical protein EYF80_004392 [Liparis tanakae]